MLLDAISIVFGVVVGLPQAFAVARPQPRNMRAISSVASIGAFLVGLSGLAHLVLHSDLLREIGLLSGLMLFIVWILMIVALARHNTSM